MSNYLTRLATRLTEPAPQIVPRPFSRFESPGAPQFAEEEDEIVRATQTLPPGRLAARPVSTAPAAAAPAARPAATVSPLSPAMKPAPSRVAALVPQVTPLTASAAQPVSQFESPAPAPPNGPPHTATQTRSELLVTAKTVVLPSTGPPKPAPGAPVARSPHPPIPNHEAAPSGPSRSAYVPATLSTTEKTETEQPIIEISVGKIEVHAPAAERKRPTGPSRPQPKLTLDAYLQQRRGGLR